MESKTDLSPVVVGCTVAGFFLLLALIIVALYMARRSKSDSNVGRRRTSRANTDSEGKSMSSIKTPNNLFHPCFLFSSAAVLILKCLRMLMFCI